MKLATLTDAQVLNTSALIQKAANHMSDLEESPAMCEWVLGAKDDRLDHDDQCGPSPSTPLSAHASRLGVLNYA